MGKMPERQDDMKYILMILIMILPFIVGYFAVGRIGQFMENVDWDIYSLPQKTSDKHDQETGKTERDKNVFLQLQASENTMISTDHCRERGKKHDPGFRRL